MRSASRDVPPPRTSDAPVLAVTMGDPGGIGPEIVCRALSPVVRRQRRWGPASRAAPVRFQVHGSHAAMLRAAETLSIEPYWWRVERGSTLVDAASRQDVVLIDSDADALRALGGVKDHPVFERAPDRLGGELSLRWVLDAIDSCGGQPTDAGQRPTRIAESAHGIVTAPICKESWDLAAKAAAKGKGSGGKRARAWPGHTELLAERFGARRYLMMFEGPRLRVALATIHLPLMDVRDVLTIGRVFDAIDMAAAGCRHLGIDRPRLAVCGLNPHAGEGGTLGDEEARLIEPAIRVARQHGIDVSGPFPGDAVFHRALIPPAADADAPRPEFDLVVAMYHDQGLIPVKLLARDETVNMTVGLPVVRTSPDHGTAFDIAGTGRADSGSMIAAIDLAVRVARGGAGAHRPTTVPADAIDP